ncbi:MAG: hypothetical protein ACRC0S_07220 [Fusobacteriaceae bacterium]
MIKSYFFSLLTVVTFICQMIEPIFNNFIVIKLFDLITDRIEWCYYFIRRVFLIIFAMFYLIYLYVSFIVKYNDGYFCNEVLGISEFLYDDIVCLYSNNYKKSAKVHLFFYLLINKKMSAFKANLELLEEIKQERISKIRKGYGLAH